MVEALFETDTAGALGLYEGDLFEESGAGAKSWLPARRSSICLHVKYAGMQQQPQ